MADTEHENTGKPDTGLRNTGPRSHGPKSHGTLLGIAVRAKSKAPMDVLEDAVITEDRGVESDSRGRPSDRQVTVLASEDWAAACDELDQPLPWTHRRANLLIDGIALKETTGSIIRIGDVELQVTGETDPCGRMDQLHSGLRKALTPDWRGGVCCRVIRGGEVHKGQAVTLASEA